VLAAALACLFLSVLLSAGLAAAAVHRHRQLQRQARDVQAAWLAESAVQRAAARLAIDPAYAGETWSVPAADFGGKYAGRAVITIAADEDLADRRRVTVEAIYPDDPIDRTRVEKTVEVRIPAEAALQK
jgi:hypothetical protein